jgi:hypothetical protein
MKCSIEVKDRKEGETIRRGLAQPDVRAFVLVMGTLSQLPNDRARARVLQYVSDYAADPTRTFAVDVE